MLVTVIGDLRYETDLHYVHLERQVNLPCAPPVGSHLHFAGDDIDVESLVQSVTFVNCGGADVEVRVDLGTWYTGSREECDAAEKGVIARGWKVIARADD